MRYRQEFTIYPRKMNGGKKVYYYRVYDENDERTSGKSTGKTSKTAANQWVQRKLKDGSLSSEKEIRFDDFSNKWWSWDECSYVKDKRRIGKISRGYVDAEASYLKNHIKPYFDPMKLSKITMGAVQKWLDQLRSDEEKHLSPTTVNHCLATLKIMLKDAERRGYILKNPCLHIENCKVNPKRKGFLNKEEVATLLDESKFKKVWKGDIQHYTLNLLVSHTELRLGEAIALKRSEIHPNRIDVNHSWSRKYGLKLPKNDFPRSIPIEPFLYDAIVKLMEFFPDAGDDDFIFFGEAYNEPLKHGVILKRLYKALLTIGISEDERKERNITFHSWRHFYNSLLRANSVTDAKIRDIMGHLSPSSTEHYTKFNVSTDFDDVRAVQRRIGA